MPIQEPSIARRPGLVAVDGRTYPLEFAKVDARAEGGIAVTTLTQGFANPHDEALEVQYTMPLPADGAVLSYTVRMGERIIRGEVQPRDKAAKAYREAIYEGKTAGLLEQDRADTFVQRLGNLPPHTRVDVEITVMQPLAFLTSIPSESEVTRGVAGPAADAPQWEYRFPTVVGPRYHGVPGRVADAERLDADRNRDGEIPTRVDLAIVIADALDSSGVTSPSHDVVHRQYGRTTRVESRHGARLDRDIVLRWNACAPEVGVRIVEGSGLDGDCDRYALITVTPPQAPSVQFHRDVTVLLDASGSMTGEPLDTAKHVVRDLIRSLEPDDRFEVLAFANKVASLTRGMARANDRSVRAALEALEALQAAGGTEMLHAVEEALAPLRDDSQHQIVLVTDGLIGFESEVIGRIVRGLPQGVRIHTVGVGSAPNRALTRDLARAGRGLELFAGGRDDAIEVAQRLRAGTVRPVLTDLVVTGTAVREVAPSRPHDVFTGKPVMITLELTPEGGDIVLRGRCAGANGDWVERVVVPKTGDATSNTPLPIGALHGREAIADLELELAAARTPFSGVVHPLASQIEARGMRHRIVSCCTSLVAIAETPSVDPKAPRRREKLAVEMPAGISAEGAGLLGDEMLGRIGSSRVGFIGADERITGAMPLFPASLLKYLACSFDLPRDDGAEIGLDPRVVVRESEVTIIIEITTPRDGFELPQKVQAVFDGRDAGAARVVKDQSSPEGPYARGLVIRIALRLMRGNWPDHGRILLMWNDDAPGTGRRTRVIELLGEELQPTSDRRP